MEQPIRALALSLLLATAPTLAATSTFAQEDVATVDKVVRNFLPGAGADSVGLVDQTEEEIAGPQAIYSGENGDIYLLDQVNARVLRFDPNDPGAAPQALQLPDDVNPTDLVVSKDTIYVWDGQIKALQATGRDDAPTRGLTFTRALGDADDATVSAFAQMGSQSPDAEADTAEGMTRSVGKQASQGRSNQTVASHGFGAMVASFKPVGGDAGVEIDLRSKDGAKSVPKLKLQVRSRLGTAEVLDVSKEGRTYVLAENIPNDSYSDQASAFVARFGASGAMEGVYELPLTADVALSRRFVTVSPEGDVYFLRSRKDRVDVLGVGFRPIKGSVVDTGGGRPAAPTFADFKRPPGAKAAVRPLTRAQVIDTAYAFANIRWRVNAGAYGSDPDQSCTGFNRVRRPGYLHGKINQDVQGIPYCWGCHGSLQQISTAIERGMPAGNICTRNDPRPNLAGVDCSAFVSACWGLQTHFSTMAIPAISKPVANPWEMLPGDAFNKPGSHVMLFLRFTPDKKVEVMESSTGGCNGKVCRNIYPLASLLARGYQPVRYRGLANDASTPTVDAVARLGAAPQGRTSAVGAAADERQPRRR